MTDVSTHIDTIVREVLRRLEHASAPAGGTERFGQWHVPGRVVSLAQLERHASAESGSPNGPVARNRLAASLADIRRITVEPGAVVTPAVVDLLRDLGITLAEGTGGRNGSGSARTVIFRVPPAQLDSQQLAGRLAEPAMPREMVCRTLDQAVRESVRAIGAGDRQAMLVTHEAAAAVCLANRHGSVRAAACYDLSMLQEARDTAGINLLVVNPGRPKPDVLLELAAQFCEQPVASCPEGWDERPRTR